jgi:hypothetical protein
MQGACPIRRPTFALLQIWLQSLLASLQGSPRDTGTFDASAQCSEISFASPLESERADGRLWSHSTPALWSVAARSSSPPMVRGSSIDSAMLCWYSASVVDDDPCARETAGADEECAVTGPVESSGGDTGVGAEVVAFETTTRTAEDDAHNWGSHSQSWGCSRKDSGCMDSSSPKLHLCSRRWAALKCLVPWNEVHWGAADCSYRTKYPTESRMVRLAAA